MLLLDSGPETGSRRELTFSTHVIPSSLILNGSGMAWLDSPPHHHRSFVVEWVA
jgi:hypothetical protein